MISARFFLAGEQYTGCEITGHADYSEEGTDVICAYVSAAVQTVANPMTEIFRLPVSAEETEEPARVSLRLSGKDDSRQRPPFICGAGVTAGRTVCALANIQVTHMEV